MKAIGLLPVILSASVVGLGIKQMNTEAPPAIKAMALDAKGNVVATAPVNERGKFSFKDLPEGTYDIKIVSEDYKDTITLKQVEANSKIAEYKTALNFRDRIAPPVSDDLEREGDMDIAVRDRSAGIMDMISAPKMPSSDEDAVGVDYDGASGGEMVEPAIDYTSPVPGETRSAKSAMDGTEGRKTEEPVADPSVVQKAGQLTAGQWRDLDNWEKWFKTNEPADVKAHQTTWGMFPAQRFAFEIADKNKKPLIAARVDLLDASGTVAWTTYTDNMGRAELWPTFYEQNPANNKYTLQITSGEQSTKFTKITYGNTIQKFEVKFESAPEMAADIAFVVDATGSMGDEISYLQAEMLDVLTRAQKNANCLNLRLGSVFYRDMGDEYVTRKNDFTNNFLEVSDFMMEQSAGGGGDFPEAVDAAMEAAIDGLKWRSNAVAKIMFLVLDAPPHAQAEQVAKMQKYTKLAAEKGIKIIPVASSGVDQSTEFLMKYLAIATNGTYVYLTDHSGIGNSHVKPTGVKEDVGYLNEMLLKIVNDNLKIEGCEINNNTTNNNTLPGTVEIKTNGQWQVQFYPNPSVNEIMVKSTEAINEVNIVSLRGQTLLSKKYDNATQQVKLDVSSFNNGVYVVTVKKGDQVITCKMMVLH